MNFFRWLIEKIKDWSDRQIAAGETENKKWDHIFKRLWESKQNLSNQSKGSYIPPLNILPPPPYPK